MADLAAIITAENLTLILGGGGIGAIIKHFIFTSEYKTRNRQSSLRDLSDKLNKKTEQIEALLISQIEELSERLDELSSQCAGQTALLEQQDREIARLKERLRQHESDSKL